MDRASFQALLSDGWHQRDWLYVYTSLECPISLLVFRNCLHTHARLDLCSSSRNRPDPFKRNTDSEDVSILLIVSSLQATR